MKVGDNYLCKTCGNKVELKVVGGGQLVCCGKPMEKV
jgi:desulfoferrodoxin-like iron-binding protein